MATDNDLIAAYAAVPPCKKPIFDQPGEDDPTTPDVDETRPIRNGQHKDVQVARAKVTGTVACRDWWPLNDPNKSYGDKWWNNVAEVAVEADAKMAISWDTGRGRVVGWLHWAYHQTASLDRLYGKLELLQNRYGNLIGYHFENFEHGPIGVKVDADVATGYLKAVNSMFRDAFPDSTRIVYDEGMYLDEHTPANNIPEEMRFGNTRTFSRFVGDIGQFDRLYLCCGVDIGHDVDTRPMWPVLGASQFNHFTGKGGKWWHGKWSYDWNIAQLVQYRELVGRFVRKHDDIAGIMDHAVHILNMDHVAALAAYTKGLNG